MGMNATQSNILMTQIRAEQKKYRKGQVRPLVGTHRDHTGKRTYRDILCRPTLSPRHDEPSRTGRSLSQGSYRSPSRSPSKNCFGGRKNE